MSQNLQNFAKFQKIQLDNLVDFEKCCKTRIYLQRSMPIQPKTSNILPKLCRSAVVSPTGTRPPGSLTSPLPARSGAPSPFRLGQLNSCGHGQNCASLVPFYRKIILSLVACFDEEVRLSRGDGGRFSRLSTY